MKTGFRLRNNPGHLVQSGGFLSLLLAIMLVLLSCQSPFELPGGNESKVLTRIEISGPSSVAENDSENYTCTAFFDDGSSATVTSEASWSENSPYATISSNGRLSVGSLSEGQTCTISASYSYGGVTKSDGISMGLLNESRVLTRIEISGPSSVAENNSENYTCTAFFDDGSSATVTSEASWSENSPYATISSNGRLSVGSLSEGQTCTISASYSYGGVTKSDGISVGLLDSSRKVSLGEGDSYDFTTQARGSYTGGQLYLAIDNCTFCFLANNVGQQGVAYLGALGEVDLQDVVVPNVVFLEWVGGCPDDIPVGVFYQFGVPARVGHYYAALAGDTGFIVFRVISISSSAVDLKYEWITGGVNWNCFHDLPAPILVAKTAETYGDYNGVAGTRYWLSVVNRAAYPDEFFEVRPELPPCGSSENTSRIEVYIFDEDHGWINGFCALTSPGDLDCIWFLVPEGGEQPDAVWVRLTDRLCAYVYDSNLVYISDFY